MAPQTSARGCHCEPSAFNTRCPLHNFAHCLTSLLRHGQCLLPSNVIRIQIATIEQAFEVHAPCLGFLPDAIRNRLAKLFFFFFLLLRGGSSPPSEPCHGHGRGCLNQQSTWNSHGCGCKSSRFAGATAFLHARASNLIEQTVELHSQDAALRRRLRGPQPVAVPCVAL